MWRQALRSEAKQVERRKIFLRASKFSPYRKSLRSFHFECLSVVSLRRLVGRYTCRSLHLSVATLVGRYTSMRGTFRFSYRYTCRSLHFEGLSVATLVGRYTSKACRSLRFEGLSVATLRSREHFVSHRKTSLFSFELHRSKRSLVRKYDTTRNYSLGEIRRSFSEPIRERQKQRNTQSDTQRERKSKFSLHRSEATDKCGDRQAFEV